MDFRAARLIPQNTQFGVVGNYQPPVDFRLADRFAKLYKNRTYCEGLPGGLQTSGHQVWTLYQVANVPRTFEMLTQLPGHVPP